MRTQQLIWHNMESQIKWTHETEYAWFSGTHIAKLSDGSYYPKIGYFITSKHLKPNLATVFRTTCGDEYIIEDLEEWAEL